MNLDIWTYFAGSIFLIFVGMFAYYSVRNAKAMKDLPGHKYIAVGAALFVSSGGIDGVAMFIAPNSILRLGSLFIWIIAILILIYAGILIGKAIKKVYSGSFLQMLWEHPGSTYNLIGISVLVIIEMPIHIMDLLYTSSGDFSLLFLININVSAFCFANLALASRIYFSLGVEPGSKHTAELPTRSGVLAIKAYGTLTNTFLTAMRPAASKVLGEALGEYFEHNPILFENCSLKPDGTINFDLIMKNVDRIYREDRIQAICIIFSALSYRLFHLYSAITSPKHAEKLLTRSYLATQKIYGEASILFDILRSLPDGVLQRERISLLSRKELEAKVNERTRELAESRNYINNVVNSMTDILIVADPDGIIKTVNKAAEELLGCDEIELIGQAVDVILTPEAAAKFRGSELDELAERGAIRNVEKIYLTKSDLQIPVLSSYSVMNDDNGDVQGIVCVAQDITERKLAEDKIKASLAEKEVLLKEIHHRVKNNLQVISSMLNLQSGYVENETAFQMFKESQNRVRSMSLIHEKLYQSEDLVRINFSEYIQELANYLFRMYGEQAQSIELKINVEDISLDIDTAIPCGLIVNELLSNSLKYAFPMKNGTFSEWDESEKEIRVELRSDDSGNLILIVSDNGIGFPENIDFRETESLGLQLVNTLVEQLDGSIDLDIDGETTFRITFEKPRIEREV